MSTITGKKDLGHGNLYDMVVSDPAGPADDVEIPVQPGNTHCFLGVQMFDVAGDPIVDSTGSFTVEVKTANTDQFEDPPEPVIDATAPTTISWAANTKAVRVTPTNLTDTVTWRVVVTANQR